MEINTIKIIVGFAPFVLMFVVSLSVGIYIEHKYGRIENLSDNAKYAIVGVELALYITAFISAGLYMENG